MAFGLAKGLDGNFLFLERILPRTEEEAYFDSVDGHTSLLFSLALVVTLL